MVTVATALICSIGLIAISVSLVGPLRVRKRRRPVPDTPVSFLATAVCHAPSPDDSVRCVETIGHCGWHQHGETSWFGDAWNYDPFPNIIGPHPLRFEIGPFSTRRPLGWRAEQRRRHESAAATYTRGDGGVLRLFGEPANGRSPHDLATGLLERRFPDAVVDYEIPHAMVGYRLGWGAAADWWPSSST